MLYTGYMSRDNLITYYKNSCRLYENVFVCIYLYVFATILGVDTKFQTYEM